MKRATMFVGKNFALLFAVLILKTAESRTLSRSETKVNPNGDKVTTTWTTTISDDDKNDLFNNIANSNIPYNSAQSLYTKSPILDVPTDELLKEASLSKGMDPDAVAEAIRTKQPVVKTTTDANGHVHTTTYNLNPDGSVSSRTIIEFKPIATQTTKNWEWNPPTLKLHSPAPTFNYPNWDSTPMFSSPRYPIDSWSSFKDIFDERRNPLETTTIKLPEAWTINNKREPIPSTTPKFPIFNNPVETTPMKFPEPWEPKPWPSNIGWKPIVSTPPKDSNVTLKPVTTIRLEDLPVNEILNNGKPIDDEFLKTLPTSLKPIQIPANTIKIDNIPMTEPFNDKPITITNPKIENSIRTITKTLSTNSIPMAGDLDPNMKEILDKAGINPNDIKSPHGDTITKTRVEPDGKIITTMYRVRVVPSTTGTFSLNNDFDKSIPLQTTDPNPPNCVNKSNPIINYPSVGHPIYNGLPKAEPNSPLSIYDSNTTSPIDSYLSKININPSDILANNGELVKTIIDENGRILTATFLLSSTKDSTESTNKISKGNPLK